MLMAFLVFSDYQDSETGNRISNFKTYQFASSRRVSNDTLTLLEGNKPVVRERWNVWLRGFSKLLAFLAIPVHQDFIARGRPKDFLMKNSCTSTEKNCFELRDNSKLMAFFRIFGLSKFWCKQQKLFSFQMDLVPQVTRYKFKPSRKNWTSFLEDFVAPSRKFNINRIFVQFTHRGKERTAFSSRFFWSTFALLTPEKLVDPKKIMTKVKTISFICFYSSIFNRFNTFFLFAKGIE